MKTKESPRKANIQRLRAEIEAASPRQQQIIRSIDTVAEARELVDPDSERVMEFTGIVIEACKVKLPHKHTHVVLVDAGISPTEVAMYTEDSVSTLFRRNHGLTITVWSNHDKCDVGNYQPGDKVKFTRIWKLKVYSGSVGIESVSQLQAQITNDCEILKIGVAESDEAVSDANNDSESVVSEATPDNQN